MFLLWEKINASTQTSTNLQCTTLALSLGWFGKWKIKLAKCLDGRWRGRRDLFMYYVWNSELWWTFVFYSNRKSMKKKNIFFFLLGKSIRIVEKIWTNRFLWIIIRPDWETKTNEWMYVRMDRDGEFIITLKWAVNKSHRFVRRNIKRLIRIIHLCHSVWKSHRIFWLGLYTN